MSRKSTKQPQAIYQLKITLSDCKPPIWRRLLVPDTFTLAQLHEAIQISMGWENYHLHQFTIDFVNYGRPSADDWEPVQDERRVTLQKLGIQKKDKFEYIYDFGDDWLHRILVEQILLPDAGAHYPVCIKGKMACPPEDVGGMFGYAEFLDAIADPNHEEHDTYLEWIGRAFDPAAFDMQAINQQLRTAFR